MIDRTQTTRRATSNSVTVAEVFLYATISRPGTAYAGDRSLTLTIEAKNTSGALVPGYRGEIDINPSTAVLGLYQSPVQGAFDDVFTAADAGQKVYTNWAFSVAGKQSVTVIDRTQTSRQRQSNSLTVSKVVLSASISPNASFAGDRSLTLTIEAKNTSGALVPGYRGEIDINPTAAVLGLPQSTIQGVFDEIFTASDAGRKVITNWGFASNGSQNVTVIDRTNTTRTATSNNVFVGSTGFRITFNTTTAVARDRAFTMTLEIVDAQGNRVPGYRGEIDINPSAPTLGLYQSPVQGAADYIFTAADAGIHTFGGSSVHVPGGWGFVPVGTNTITIIDRTDPSLTRTSQPLITTLPPEPQPVPVTPAPATETIPATIPAQPAIPYGWGAPMDMAVYNSGAFWKGYPKAIVPSGPGTRYVVTGSVKKGFWEWDWGSYYTGVYLGWENPPTSERHFGVTEYLPSQDTTFTAGVIDDGIRATTTGWLSGWSSYFNDDAEAFLGPY